jgi:flagellar biosynthesis chaperone FliJ
MQSATDFTRQLHDARQLKRLRELRERSALNALRKAEAVLQAAIQVMQARENTILNLQGERHALAERIIGELAADMARLADYASARQSVLDEQLERAEYLLTEDQKVVANAQVKVNEARQAWLRTVSRHGTASTLVDDANQALRRDREVRAEREDIPQSTPIT